MALTCALVYMEIDVYSRKENRQKRVQTIDSMDRSLETFSVSLQTLIHQDPAFVLDWI